MAEVSAKQMMIQADLALRTERAATFKTLTSCNTRRMLVTKSRFAHLQKSQNKLWDVPAGNVKPSGEQVFDFADAGYYPQQRMYIVSFVIFMVITFACAGNQNGSGPAISVEELGKLRQNMVNRQIIARGIKDPLVLEAMNNVERHHFVLPGQERQAYEDGPLSIGEGQTISQPYIVAIMTELAKIGPDSKVLEIGTGSGYQAAILGEIAREVYTIEIIESLGLRAQNLLQRLGYKNVKVRIGDGYKGWPESAPFDAIVVTAAPDHIPQPLVDQLKIGGRLVIPVGELYQELEVITRTPTGVNREKIIPVRFVPMTGEAEENQK